MVISLSRGEFNINPYQNLKKVLLYLFLIYNQSKKNPSLSVHSLSKGVIITERLRMLKTGLHWIVSHLN